MLDFGQPEADRQADADWSQWAQWEGKSPTMSDDLRRRATEAPAARLQPRGRRLLRRMLNYIASLLP